MTNVMDEFPDLKDKSIAELHSIYNSLKGDGPTRELTDDSLKTLLAISRVLRGRATAPTSKSTKKAPPPGLDAL